jgi:hypothetical protein
MFKAKALADSISPDGVRLTTLEVCFPRIVLAEFNTHRVFTKNSASSRAIPVDKMIKMALENPYIPFHWGQNQKGMSAEETIPDYLKPEAEKIWIQARDNAIGSVKALQAIGVHKQITNRLLEPFMWHTVIVSSTEWDNFFKQRCSSFAHPDINSIAVMMKYIISGAWEKTKNVIDTALNISVPVFKDYGEWHLPLLPDIIEIKQKYNLEVHKKISTGRCARVSYMTHDGKRDFKEDIKLHDKLLEDGHMSPFEHIARPLSHSEVDGFPGDTFVGNFRGWFQYRKEIPGENGITI